MVIKMIDKKKGGMSLNPDKMIDWVLGAVVGISVIAYTIGLVFNATILLSTEENMPLKSFFTANGIVILILGIAVITLIIKSARGGNR